jgi:integrase/recombinase XerD
VRSSGWPSTIWPPSTVGPMTVDPTPPPKPVPSENLAPAVTAYLSRYKGLSREHTHSDLRVFLTWCAGQELDPLTARRHQFELYVRWLQEVRPYKPSTVSRRTSEVAGFYRTCVIDGVLARSPADYLRRPTVPAEHDPPRDCPVMPMTAKSVR